MLFRFNQFQKSAFLWVLSQPGLVTIFLVLPLFLYWGGHSLIAQDEGYYANQAKLILQQHQWLVPQSFHHVVFDRTMGLQWLIAVSYWFLGETVFAARLTVLIAAALSLFFTYQLAQYFSQQLRLSQWFASVSTILLALTPVWLNYSHYAGQDIPLLAVELLGIYAILQAKETKSSVWLFSIGPILAIAFFIKGFMVAIPIAAILPYLILKQSSIFKRLFFWLGLLIGVLIVAAWLSLCLHQYGYAVVSELWGKLITLSKDKHSVYARHGFYYYFWNVPLNFFPWLFFAIGGWVKILNKRHDYSAVYFLFWYPVIIFILLTMFNTKTPYYPIQMTPFVAMSAAYFILAGFELRWKINNILFTLFAMLGVLFCVIILTVYIGHFFHWFELASWYQVRLYSTLLLALALPWAVLFLVKSNKTKIILFIGGSWLILTLVVQFGLLNDRHPHLRKVMSQSKIQKVVFDNTINFVEGATPSVDEGKQVLLLAFYSKYIGNLYSSLAALPNNSYAWVHTSIDEQSRMTVSVIAKLPQSLGGWFLVHKTARHR